MLVWKIILSNVTNNQIRAQTLLDQWHRFRSSRVCNDVLDIQQTKDRLEKMAVSIATGMYCMPADPELNSSCDRFEQELGKLKEKIYQDLLVGLQSSKTK